MIGLLSFHNVINYGAVLQSYALQKTIEKLGYNSEYVNVSFSTSQVDGKSKITKAKNIIHKFKGVKTKIYGKIKSKRFKNFRDKYLHISDEHYPKGVVIDLPKYNKYIVGSDQVWNFSITNSSECFLLDFVSSKKSKYSYASSFGVESLPDGQKQVFRKWLKEFECISVREKQGLDIVYDLIGINPEVNLDPSLLIEKKEWDNIADKPNFCGYVFLYLMAESDALIEYAKKLAKIKNKKIVAVGLKKKVKGIKTIYTASPQRWLGLLLNADTIITNSFHGIAFSVNFNKSFYFDLLPNGWIVNSRIENIIDLFGLHSRSICNKNVVDENIDFQNINNILYGERKRSIDYLKKVCDSCE